MKKAMALLTIILIAWSCNTISRNYRLGMESAMNKNWDEAVRYYERAVLEDPKSSYYRLALERAKMSAANFHISQARKLASKGEKENALAEYELASFYDPGPFYKIINQESERLREEKKEEPKVEKMELPVKLQIKVEEKLKLKFSQNANLRSIFQALGKYSGINVIFDEGFRDKPFPIDLTDMSFEQALNTVCVASKNFYRIIDGQTVIIVPDQPVNRTKYEINAIKTFYVSNIDAQEIQAHLQQMLRTPYKAPSLVVNQSLNSITVRDVPEIIELAEKIIKRWDKPKGEVLIELEIMQVSRIRLRELGLELEQYGIGLGYKTTGETGWETLNNLDFSKTENYQIALPASVFNFLESDSNTKTIAQPRLRGVDGEQIEYLVGDEIPIPRTTFTPIAAGGVSQQPVTSFEYKNVGIDVKITPTVHVENEITLQVEIKIKSIAGSGYADIPIIATRDVKNVIRLKDGETNLLAGLLKDEERLTVKGLPWLKDIPLIGDLFSSTEQTVQQTDVVLTITPHIIRSIPLTEDDSKPLWVNVSGASPSGSSSGQRLPEDALFDPEMRRQRILQERERADEKSAINQVSLNPTNFEVPEKREFRINVNLRSAEELGNMSFVLSFNSQILELKQVLMGGFVRQFGENPSFLKNIDNSSGACTIGFSSPDMSRGFKGTGVVATLVFNTKAKGESTVSVTSITANRPGGQAVSFETSESRVRVR